jgi:hypothetical protein
VTAKRDFTYRRPSGGGGTPSFLYRLSRELRGDVRFEALTPSQRYALVLAVEQYADAAGEFFLSYRTWAAESGVKRRSLQYMVASCESSGLLKVTTFAKGPGGTKSQRANNYAVDSELVERVATRGAKSGDSLGVQKLHQTRSAKNAHRTSLTFLTGATALPSRDGSRPRKFISPAEAVKRGPGR